MNSDNIKEGLDGLSKIDGVSNTLYIAIYCLAIIFVLLFVSYLFACLSCYLNKKRSGGKVEKDNFLDD